MIVAYGNFSDAFLDALRRRIGGHRILEVFAGNGLLASRLAARGVDVLATTLFRSHDGHEFGLHHDVHEMDAERAVRERGADRDVLLMSWPTADASALRAALAWGSLRPILFIGEITRPDLGFAGLGGCASDEFFAMTEIVGDLDAYEPRNMLDRAVEMRLRDSGRA